MKTLLPFSLIVLSACQLGPTQKDLDALLVNPNAEVQAELASAISSMLNNDKILIKAEDFAKSSTVALERVILKDADGLRLQGMELEMPSVFKLIKRGDDCLLIRLKSDQERLIKTAQCKAAPEVKK